MRITITIALAALVALAAVGCSDTYVTHEEQPAPPDPAPESCVTTPPEISFASEGAERAAIDLVSGETAYELVTVTNRNAAACPPADYEVTISQPYGSEIEVGLRSGDWQSVRIALASGASTGIPMDILPAPDYEDPGTASGYGIQLAVAEPGAAGDPLARAYVFVRVTHLASGCAVSRSREIMIVDPSVVDDPRRTTGRGAWTIASLMEQLAPAPDLAPGMFERAIRGMAEIQIINRFIVSGRSVIGALADTWPRSADGLLDLERVPARLQAIVPRLDLRDLSSGRAGRVNLVFAILDTLDGQHAEPTEFTLILEYDLPAKTEEDVARWAARVHALGDLRFGAEYNAALQAITDRVTLGGSYAGRPGDSALVAMRTSESIGGNVREFREFRISPVTKFLEPVATEGTPDTYYAQHPLLAGFVAERAAELIAGHAVVVPEELPGEPGAFGIPFRAGTSRAIPDSPAGSMAGWLSAVDGVDAVARRTFARNTCNGCHGPETLTAASHIIPRRAGDPAAMSPFLAGTRPQDSDGPNRRHHDDVDRRVRDLERIVCAGPDGPGMSALRLGAERTH
jgi:hypothetical protein